MAIMVDLITLMAFTGQQEETTHLKCYSHFDQHTNPNTHRFGTAALGWPCQMFLQMLKKPFLGLKLVIAYD